MKKANLQISFYKKSNSKSNKIIIFQNLFHLKEILKFNNNNNRKNNNLLRNKLMNLQIF